MTKMLRKSRDVPKIYQQLYGSGITLVEAMDFAAKAHEGQIYGKYGNPTPYIFHPLRVMLRVSEKARVVAVLHDVLEDCNTIPKDLNLYDYAAIRLLTHEPTDTYKEYIEKIANSKGPGSEIAKEVKLADLSENVDHTPAHISVDKYLDAAATILYS